MKQFIPALCALLFLTACGSGNQPAATAVSESSKPDTPLASQPAGSNEIEPAEDPRDHMEDYECMEVAFLGLADQNESVKDVLEHARMNFPGFSWLSAVSDEDIIYGDQGSTSNNVYVILPAETTDLRIGRYSWHAGEITDVFYEEENSGPVVFVENSEAVSPTARIEYARHYFENESEDGIYTGFSVASGKLRTEYHMGTVDTTPYEQFSSAEVPFYKQSFYDRLTSMEDIQSQLDKGAALAIMDEMIYESYAYALYDLEKKDGSHTGYAITPDPDAPYKVMYADDFISWQPLGMG